MKKTKAYSCTATQQPITPWEIRILVDDIRGLIHCIYLTLLVIAVISLIKLFV
jgi:hypothetical protein